MNVILENSEEFRNREKKTRKKKKNLDFFTFLSQKTKTIDNIQNQLKIVYSDSRLSFVKKTTKKENLNSLSDFKNISTNSFFQKENLGWERRKLGLCLIRGDQIISISFD
jgi:small nuclear ribonucleoprotein (snRNP)-like protein